MTTTVAVIGPGAIGCVVAGALAQRQALGAASLVVCARHAFERIVLSGSTGEHDLVVRVVTDPGQLRGPVDVVVLATKTYQTPGAAPWLDATCAPGSIVLVCQNGIEQRDLVEPLVAGATVVPAVVQLPADRSAPGVVHVGGRARLVVADSDAGRRCAELFDGSLLDVAARADFAEQAWRKLMMNAAVGAVTVLTRRSLDVLDDPDAAAIAARIMEEVAEVARAEGVDIPAGLGTSMVASAVGTARGHTSSIAVDRLAGRPTEWRARNEVVVRLADRHGLEVPVSRLLTPLLRLGEPRPDEG
ncbi:MAG: 2-dehydropantoate 2-reductase [Acidimicrobiia bacterium]|nr:2-dehydropantoate 2-reductase [Acidimicrobiia bacterium]